MNKVILVMICIIVIIGAIFTAIFISKPNQDEDIVNITTKVAEEEILDECTDEYEYLENQEIALTNSDEEKVSPNCSITIKTFYKKCGHTTSEYDNIPEKLVNCTKEDIQNKYEGYKVEKFSSNEIILYIEKDGECGEHYIVRDKDGTVMIYRNIGNGEEEFVEETGISTDYLPETDKINMKNGIQVNGKQDLNQLIEDFE